MFIIKADSKRTLEIMLDLDNMKRKILKAVYACSKTRRFRLLNNREYSREIDEIVMSLFDDIRNIDSKIMNCTYDEYGGDESERGEETES